ncbi:hypothetical protein, partial [Streptomyces diastatochromogenes]|uniref:hypothetical protein n=1 Tax=Streptomyces diastatochromogenes TaxID=42236 RepID=UPI0036A9B8F0
EAALRAGAPPGDDPNVTTRGTRKTPTAPTPPPPPPRCVVHGDPLVGELSSASDESSRRK